MAQGRFGKVLPMEETEYRIHTGLSLHYILQLHMNVYEFIHMNESFSQKKKKSLI